MSKIVLEYKDLLTSVMKVQNFLLKLHQERFDIYNSYFFSKRLLNLKFGPRNKEALLKRLRSINRAERAYIEIIQKNDPRKNLSLGNEIPVDVIKNLLSYFDSILGHQKEFLEVELNWLNKSATKSELFKSYHVLLEGITNYSELNQTVIKNYGGYLTGLKAFLENKKQSPGVSIYPLYILPFVVLFDPFLDAYYYLFKDIPMTPLPGKDNLAVLVVACFLVYLDLPTKVGNIYAKHFNKFMDSLKSEGAFY